MNKKVKRKWLKALRSGEYRQGDGQLVRTPHSEEPKKGKSDTGRHPTEYKFCCLGVLENLYCLEHNLDFTDGLWDEGSHSMRCNEWAELDSARGEDIVTGKDWWGDNNYEANSEHLAEMNDGGRRFTTIANWIEKNL